MTKKIEILVKDEETVAKVGRKKFNLGKVGFVSVGRTFSLDNKKEAQIEFYYYDLNNARDSYREIFNLNKEIGDGAVSQRQVELLYRYSIDINLEKYRPISKIK